MRDVLLKNQPNKRFATVEELGALTMFLCSPARLRLPGPRCRSMAAGLRTEVLVGGRDAGRHVPPVGHDRR